MNQQDIKDVVLISKYTHIDNGGVVYKLGVREDHSPENGGCVIKSPFMILNTNYYGYPEIEVKLSTWAGHLNSSFFRQMGLDLIKFADKLEELGDKSALENNNRD